MTKARRQRIWDRDGGVCYWCTGAVVDGQPWDVEHKDAWAISRDDSDPNLGVIHRLPCHREKTDQDLARLAKAKAQGGETGQWARRQRNGPQIKSGPPRWAKGRKMASRPFPTRRPST
jgi:hypothetical protein